MEPLQTFNEVSLIEPRGLYNTAKPFVLVNIGDSNPTRGDVHGYEGIAKRLAAKIGGEYMLVSHDILSEQYPDIPNPADDPEDYNSIGRTSRLRQLFNDKGRPDFLFSTKMRGREKILVAEEGKGVFISVINEGLVDALCLPYGMFPTYVVPHHLTQDTLEYEGQRFGEEFQELPRPFIGVLLSTAFSTNCMDQLGKKLGALKDAYETGTFFICTSRRTENGNYSEFQNAFAKALAGAEDRFPVIKFDYKLNADSYGRDGFWNPYAGIIAQADHLVITNESQSMLSEGLAAGRMVYSFGMRDPQYFKDLFLHEDGKPLDTPAIQPPDATGACVDKLIDLHKTHIRASYAKQSSYMWIA